MSTTPAVSLPSGPVIRPPASGLAIEAVQLAKNFGGKPAVAGVSLQVPVGVVRPPAA